MVIIVVINYYQKYKEIWVDLIYEFVMYMEGCYIFNNNAAVLVTLNIIYTVAFTRQYDDVIF